MGGVVIAMHDVSGCQAHAHTAQEQPEVTLRNPLSLYLDRTLLTHELAHYFTFHYEPVLQTLMDPSTSSG